RALQYQFECGCIERIADQCIGQAQAEAIERAGDRPAGILESLAPQILHGGVDAGLNELKCGCHDARTSLGTSYVPAWVAARMSSNCAAVTGSKRTLSPGLNRAGRGWAASNRRIGVVPIRCQPPGLSSG